MKKEQLKKESKKKSTSTKAPLQDKVESRNRKYDLIGLAMIILLGIVIYSNSFQCSFHFDDFGSIVENEKIRDLSDWKSWWNYSHTRLVSYYSFALNYHFGQLNVWGYHLVNLFVHLINACLVWWLTMLIFSSPVMKDHPILKYKNELAFITALLFVSHPLATQSVTYIVQRMASMVAMFYFFSIAFYLKARLTEGGNISRSLLFAGSIISAVLAMLTKENAFTLPFAIILVEFFFIRTKKISFDFKDHRFILVIAGLIGFIIIVALKFTFNIFNPIPPSQGHTYTLTAYNYLLTQFSVIVKYIQILLLPINQMVDYGFPLATNFFEIRTLVSFLLLTLLIIFAIFLFSKNKLISFGIFWFFLTLSIESSIIPIQDLIYEHRTYLPSFGFFLILSAVLFLLFREKNKLIAFAILAIIIISNSYLTFERNKVWKDDLSFWSDNVKKAPYAARPIANRGFAYRSLGQWDKALEDNTRALKINPDYTVALSNRGVVYAHFEQWQNAVNDYSRAIKVDPNFADAYSNRGAVYNSLNEWNKAISDYTKAIALKPKFYKAYYNRGISYGNLKEWDKAIADYSKAIAINPEYADAYQNRGIAYGGLRQWDKAIDDYSKTIELDPKNHKAYYSRGIVYMNLNEWNKAIADYSFAIGIDPNYFNAYYNRGIVYGNLKEWNKAIADYTAVIKIDPDNKQAFVNRGVAYANLDQWEKAIEDYTRALQFDPNFPVAINNLAVARQNVKIRKKQ